MQRNLSNMNSRRKDHLCLAFLVALAVLFLYRVVFMGKALLPADVLLLMTPWRHHAAEKFPEFHQAWNPMLDVIQQYYPWRQFAAQWIRKDVFPLWNPHMYSGTPFVANGQSAIFYPFNCLFYLMPVKYAFGWTALLHLMLIGVSSYGFFKHITGHRIAALTGAIAFMFCGFVTAWLEFTTFLCTAAWLPVTLFLFERALAPRSSKEGERFVRGMALTGVALGMSLLAGHLQIGFYVWLTFGLYALYRAFSFMRRLPGSPPHLLSSTGANHSRLTHSPAHPLTGFVGGIALAVGIGLCLGAPQWLPVIELTHFSTRSGAFDIESIRPMRLPLQHLLTLLIPSFFGNPVDSNNYWGAFNFYELSGSLGVLPLLLWLPAVWGRSWRSAGFWILLLAFGFSVAMVTPLYWLFVWCIPGFAQLRGPARALLIADFAGAALAAYGVRALCESGRPFGKHFRVTMLAATGVFLFVGLWGVLHFSGIMLSDRYFAWTTRDVATFLIFLAFGLGLILWSSRGVQGNPAKGRDQQTRGNAAVRLMPLLVAIELFVLWMRFNPQVDPGMVYFDTESTRFLKRDHSTFRVLSIGSNFLHWMPSNAPMAFGLEDIQGSDSLWTMSYAQYLQSIEPGAPRCDWKNYNSPKLDDLNVKYVLTPPDMYPDSPPGRLVYDGDMKIYRRQQFKPRFFLSDGRTPAIISQNPDHIALNVEESAARPHALTPSPPHPLTLSWSHPFYPGWQAWVDGGRRPLECRSEVVQQVPFQTGERQMDFVFYPMSVYVGMFLACLSVGACALLLARGLTRATRPEHGRSGG